jgi:hypothetical protein
VLSSLEPCTQNYHNLDFVERLVVDLVYTDPAKGPSLNEVEAAYGKLARQLSQSKLKWHLANRKQSSIETCIRDTSHLTRGFFGGSASRQGKGARPEHDGPNSCQMNRFVRSDVERAGSFALIALLECTGICKNASQSRESK